MNMNRSIGKKDNNTKSNLHLEVHQYKRSFIISEGDSSSQNECIENSSEDKFDWDWIFEKGWLRTKK